MIADVAPSVAGGRYPAKRVVGEPVTVGATAFADGHDRVHVVVSHRPPPAAGTKGRIDVPMTSVNAGLDRWEATFTPVAVGRHRFEVQAWIDPFATWRDATRRKLDAGVDTPGDLLAGAHLLEQLAEVAAKRDAKALRAAAVALADGDASAVADDACRRRARDAGPVGPASHGGHRQRDADRRGGARASPVLGLVRAVPPVDHRRRPVGGRTQRDHP